MASASRNCGTSIRPSMCRAASSTRRAGRSTRHWGGGFLYHQANNQVALGFVVALDYKNPYLSPFEELQRWKKHPGDPPRSSKAASASPTARARSTRAAGSRCRKLVFPGGALIGCSAGFVNVPRIKGTPHRDEERHDGRRGRLSTRSWRIATATSSTPIPTAFERRAGSPRSCKLVRNVEPRWRSSAARSARCSAGATCGCAHLGIGLPFTMKHHRRHETLWRKDQVKPIDYPKPDGVLSFDRLSSVFLSNTNHEEDQPVHLTLKDATSRSRINLPIYDEPEQRYCPAGVYEIVGEDEGDARASRSTRRTASTARPATSRTRPRTSTGWCPKAAAVRIIRTCDRGRASLGHLHAFSSSQPLQRHPSESRDLARDMLRPPRGDPSFRWDDERRRDEGIRGAAKLSRLPRAAGWRKDRARGLNHLCRACHR